MSLVPRLGRGSASGRERREVEAGAVRRRLGYVLFAIAVFLASLVATLPLDLLVARGLDQALAGSPITARVRTARWAFPLGVTLGGVRVASTRDPALAVDLESLTIHPSLLGLVTGRPDGARFTGRLAGGELSGSVDLAAARLATTIDLGGVSLATLTESLIAPPGRIDGRAALHLEISGDGKTTRSTSGVIRGRIDGPGLQRVRVAGWAVPDLVFREAVIDAQIREGRVAVKELRATGDELDASATGEAVLREPLTATTLALQLTLRTGATARPEIRVLAGMLPKRTAPDQPYSIGGTLAAPVLR